MAGSAVTRDDARPVQAGRLAPSGRAVGIELRGATKRFISPTGVALTALESFSLEIAAGEFCAIVGPTGCGKSTTLTMVSGLAAPSAGTVMVGGTAVHGVTPNTGFMFQADALMPWKSVLQNVMMGPIFNGVAKAQARVAAADWLRRVGLAGFEDHYPHQLSGGMRKRVSLAGALINEPSILMMDEPFGALDVQTRAIMSNELLGLWEQTRPTVLFVTHDLEEAIALADKVVVVTASPGTVKAVFEIDLPRPRGQVQEIRFGDRFRELHYQIWNSLREEVERAYAKTAGPNVADDGSDR